MWFFIHRHRKELGRNITKVPQAVMDALQHHSWPGNVRELENVVERAMIASNGDILQLDEPVRFQSPSAVQTAASDNLDDVQRMHIETVLQRCGWRINGSGNAAERWGASQHPAIRMKKPRGGSRGGARRRKRESGYIC